VKDELIIRPACAGDVVRLHDLIVRSVYALLGSYYSRDQLDAALGPVFGVDAQLIRDGTYFVVEEGSILVGCGGWSYRQAVFGGDRDRAELQKQLVPGKDPARVRAFFVDPARTRRGIGRLILQACEEAITAAGFDEAILVATLAGEPFYRACEYRADRRYEVPLSNGALLPVVAMSKRLQ
jgi:GNAT superfamily N-acetyltransferase